MTSLVRRAVGGLVLLLALLAQTIVTGVVAHASTTSLSPYESAIVDMTNATRTQQGLQPLTARPGLTDVARRWALAMAQAGTLSHNPSLGDLLENNGAPGWTVAAENVGTGGAASGVYAAYMNSAPHRANILRSTVDSVGVGAVRTTDGRVWDVMVFSNGYNAGYSGASTAPMAISADGQPASGASAGLPVALSMKPGSPLGHLDSVKVTGPGQVSVGGWALDPDTASSIRVDTYVGSRGMSSTAAASRSDIDRAFGGYGAAHGYTATMSGLAAGTYPVCSYAINTGKGANVRLGCTNVTLGGSPVGHVDSIKQSGPGQLTVTGWSLDPDTASSTQVAVYVGSRGKSVTADGTRSDVGRIYAGFGTQHGFTATLGGLGSGTYPVCSYGINTASGRNTLLGCTSVTLGGSPFGSLDSATVSGSTMTLSGWALDPDTAGAVPVHVYVDGKGVAYQTGTTRTDVGRIYPGFGDDHGFTITRAVAPGAHTVCVYAINAAGAGSNKLLTCTSVSA